MIIYTPPKPADHIPVVDLAGNPAHDIHKACRETGFFYVANHGIAPSLIEGQFAQARRFFELPLDDKLRLNLKNSKTAAGYAPLAVQRLDSQDAKSRAAPPDLKESFAFGAEVPADHPFAGTRGFGGNQWPALPGFRDQMLAYQAALQALGNRLLELVAASLELPRGHFAPYYDLPMPNTRLLKYPPQPANTEFNQLGAGAHTDWGAITLLVQDDLGGLEVANVTGEWLQARPIPGTFVVNLGDLMARWTNGLYQSTMHRVRNNHSAHDRYSVAFFYSPRPNATVSCLPNCSDASRPAQFPPCTVREHLDEMFRRSYGFKPGQAQATTT